MNPDGDMVRAVSIDEHDLSLKALQALSRRELQSLAKRHGCKANAKSCDIIAELCRDRHSVEAAEAAEPAAALAKPPSPEGGERKKKRKTWQTPVEHVDLPEVSGEDPPSASVPPPLPAEADAFRLPLSIVEHAEVERSTSRGLLQSPPPPPQALRPLPPPLTSPPASASIRPALACQAAASRCAAATSSRAQLLHLGVVPTYAASALQEGAAASAAASVSAAKSAAEPTDARSGEDFLAAIHQRVAVLAASPAAKHGRLRQSLSSLSSTLLDAMIVSRSTSQATTAAVAAAAVAEARGDGAEGVGSDCPAAAVPHTSLLASPRPSSLPRSTSLPRSSPSARPSPTFRRPTSAMSSAVCKKSLCKGSASARPPPGHVTEERALSAVKLSAKKPRWH